MFFIGHFSIFTAWPDFICKWKWWDSCNKSSLVDSQISLVSEAQMCVEGSLSIRNSFYSNVFKLWVFCRYWYVTFWNRENVAFAAVVGGKRWRRHVWNTKCVVFSSLQIPMHPNLFWSRNTVKNATYTKLSSIPTVRELAFTYAQK